MQWVITRNSRFTPASPFHNPQSLQQATNLAFPSRLLTILQGRHPRSHRRRRSQFCARPTGTGHRRPNRHHERPVHQPLDAGSSFDPHPCRKVRSHGHGARPGPKFLHLKVQHAGALPPAGAVSRAGPRELKVPLFRLETPSTQGWCSR